VLGFESVDAGGGWLIFGLPPAEAAVHPADGSATDLYFMCDDLQSEMHRLHAQGVELSEVEEADGDPRRGFVSREAARSVSTNPAIRRRWTGNDGTSIDLVRSLTT
jgi:hypothetical protein